MGAIVASRSCAADRERKRLWRFPSSTFEDYLASVDLRSDSRSSLTFEALPFNHPALIVFSSGTTGEPKSICHSAGGILVNSKKEGLLQYELTSAVRVCLPWT